MVIVAADDELLQVGFCPYQAFSSVVYSQFAMNEVSDQKVGQKAQ